MIVITISKILSVPNSSLFKNNKKNKLLLKVPQRDIYHILLESENLLYHNGFEIQIYTNKPLLFVKIGIIENEKKNYKILPV